MQSKKRLKAAALRHCTHLLLQSLELKPETHRLQFVSV